MNYTYLLECADGTLYCGWTNDLSRRLEAHSRGTGSRYTRSRLPVRLVYHECLETRSEAMRREAAIKRLSREEKRALISVKAPGPDTGMNTETETDTDTGTH